MNYLIIFTIAGLITLLLIGYPYLIRIAIIIFSALSVILLLDIFFFWILDNAGLLTCIAIIFIALATLIITISNDSNFPITEGLRNDDYLRDVEMSNDLLSIGLEQKGNRPDENFDWLIGNGVPDPIPSKITWRKQALNRLKYLLGEFVSNRLEDLKYDTRKLIKDIKFNYFFIDQKDLIRGGRSAHFPFFKNDDNNHLLMEDFQECLSKIRSKNIGLKVNSILLKISIYELLFVGILFRNGFYSVLELQIVPIISLVFDFFFLDKYIGEKKYWLHKAKCIMQIIHNRNEIIFATVVENKIIFATLSKIELKAEWILFGKDSNTGETILLFWELMSMKNIARISQWFESPAGLKKCIRVNEPA